MADLGKYMKLHTRVLEINWNSSQGIWNMFVFSPHHDINTY